MRSIIDIHGAGPDHQSAAIPHAFLRCHQACAAPMFSGRIPWFSGMHLASFAPCVRKDRRGSQVGHRMFARAYNYGMKLLAYVLINLRAFCGV